MSDFAKNLKIFRKQKNMTQMQLAKKLNYGYTAISNYESGRNELSFDDLIRLAQILDVTPDELLGVEFISKEKKFVSSFEKLNDENKNRILDLIQALQN